jgi:hypothetical protein
MGKPIPDMYVKAAGEIAKAAAESNGTYALDYPEKVAELIKVAANAMRDLVVGTDR